MKTHTEGKTRTIGSWGECDLVFEDKQVAPVHAQVQLGDDGFITVLDAGTDDGTFLQRNEQWIRFVKIELGSQDRIRCGSQVIRAEQLVGLFGEQTRVQLRDNRSLRIPSGLEERLAAAEKRVVFERPRRNPETGNIEEDLP